MNRFSRIWLVMATVVMLCFTTIATSEAADKPTRSRLWHSCHDMRIVAHRGVIGPGIDENTLKALRVAAQAKAEVFETDLQPSASGTAWDMHDRTVDRTTRGHGVVGKMTDKQLRGLRTTHGYPVPYDDQLIQFMKNHKAIDGQWELKNYGWAPSELKALAEKVIAADLEDRIAWASSSRWILLKMAKFAPGMRLEWIGFFEDLPPLAKFGKKIHQANVLYKAAFRKYAGYATYIKAAHARGIDVSVRSTASGEGDNPTVWKREITAGVWQIVTNRLPAYKRWCNAA